MIVKSNYYGSHFAAQKVGTALGLTAKTSGNSMDFS